MARVNTRYPQELKDRAVRLVVESREDYESEWAAIESVARKLGIGSTETLRITVVEVDRPNRRKGKSDNLDAINAARAALSGEASATPKTQTGNVESIRVLRVTPVGAVKARTQALNQLRALVTTAPDELRDRFRGLTIYRVVTGCAALRPGAGDGTTTVTKLALRSLARRIQQLDVKIADIDRVLHPVVQRTAPKLVAVGGVGPDTAAALLTAAGDNAHRLRREAAFARCAAPHPSPPDPARPTAGTGCIAAATGRPTPRCGAS